MGWLIVYGGSPYVTGFRLLRKGIQMEKEPDFRPSYFPYPESWDGWGPQDHPSPVARVIFDILISHPRVELIVGLSEQETFDLMTKLHAFTWTKVQERARSGFSSSGAIEESGPV